MSAQSSAEESRPVRRAIRTVSPLPRGRPDREMDAVGWGIFLGLLVLLLPLLPYLVLAWLVAKLLSFGRRQVAGT